MKAFGQVGASQQGNESEVIGGVRDEEVYEDN